MLHTSIGTKHALLIVHSNIHNIACSCSRQCCAGDCRGCHLATGSVTDPEAVEAATKSALAQFGSDKLHAIINNAGIANPYIPEPHTDVTAQLQHWQRVIDTSLTGDLASVSMTICVHTRVHGHKCTLRNIYIQAWHCISIVWMTAGCGCACVLPVLGHGLVICPCTSMYI